MSFGAYDTGYASESYGAVPDIVKQFVVYLYRHIRERNIPEIQSMYEVSFAKLSDRYFKNSSWPPVDAIEGFVDGDHVFCLLYKELYYRHLYAKCQPDLRQRCESWDNYCELFGVILHGNVNMQLPNNWLWDMVDEFIYQFQSFCQYRGKVAKKSPEELQLLKECDKVWAVLDVLNVLQALVDKSNIVAELSVDNGARLYQTEGFYGTGSNVLRMLGYFSLIGQLRVHSLVGDYHTALTALHPINVFDRAHLFAPKIAGCNISVYYYTGFCYMMMRRYTDAAKCFNIVLTFIARVKTYYARSNQYEQMLMKNEQMYSLLAICVAMSPVCQQLLDENVANLLRERHTDKIPKMNRGDEPVFDELFSYACPKFITTTPPVFDNPSNTFQEAYRNQLSLFLQEVRSQQTLPKLKQYLILYSSIPMTKLALLMETDEAALRTMLICLKNKSYNLQYSSGPDLNSGAFVSTSDIDFFIDLDPETGKEMVIVSDTVHTRHHAEFLTRQINKFEEIIRDLSMPPQTKAQQQVY